MGTISLKGHMPPIDQSRLVTLNCWQILKTCVGCVLFDLEMNFYGRVMEDILFWGSDGVIRGIIENIDIWKVFDEKFGHILRK